MFKISSMFALCCVFSSLCAFCFSSLSPIFLSRLVDLYRFVGFSPALLSLSEPFQTALSLKGVKLWLWNMSAGAKKRLNPMTRLVFRWRIWDGHPCVVNRETTHRSCTIIVKYVINYSEIFWDMSDQWNQSAVAWDNCSHGPTNDISYLRKDPQKALDFWSQCGQQFSLTAADQVARLRKEARVLRW